MARSKVKAVTAYVPLGLTYRPSPAFHALGERLIHAARDRIAVFNDFPLSACWTVVEGWYRYPAANKRAEDRFADDIQHLNSNLIQHCPVQWVQLAAQRYPDVDVFVWLGYSLLKQGNFTGKPIQEHHVTDFLDKLEGWAPDCIPFPGITPPRPVDPFGDNWRFCGSTVIFPRRWLDPMVLCYKRMFREFMRVYKAVPLDLAIWPLVEQKCALPFRFYQAEYDHTQLTNFPG